LALNAAPPGGTSTDAKALIALHPADRAHTRVAEGALAELRGLEGVAVAKRLN